MKKLHREYLTFLSVCAVILTVYAINHIAPFGDRSILWSDLYHQYAPFLKELRDKLLHGESLFYSWSTGLGKDFLVQAAYYTASPLDLLVLCFPGEHLSEGVAVLITLKTALCGMSFSWYLRKRFQKNDSSIIVFGLLYAFCGFVTCYYWNIMWLDTVILFPYFHTDPDGASREGTAFSDPLPVSQIPAGVRPGHSFLCSHFAAGHSGTGQKGRWYPRILLPFYLFKYFSVAGRPLRGRPSKRAVRDR